MATTHTVIRTEGQFEIQKVDGMLMGQPLTGFVVWDDTHGESVGPGMVSTLEDAELLLECGHASERQEMLRLAHRLCRR